MNPHVPDFLRGIPGCILALSGLGRNDPPARASPIGCPLEQPPVTQPPFGRACPVLMTPLSEALRNRYVIAARLGEYSARAARQLFAEARIATYETPDSGVAGFLHRVHYRHNRELLMETPSARRDTFEADPGAAQRVIATALAAGDTWLDPKATGTLLAGYGVPVTASSPADDADQAACVATAIGFPVALKILSADITHKIDVGGIALNLGNADRVRREAAAMLGRVREARPQARLNGFLVQPMVGRPGAVELLVGLVEDPVFGPLLSFGQGGTAVEVVHDTSLELPPLNALLARRLMGRTRVSRLLTTARISRPTAREGRGCHRSVDPPRSARRRSPGGP